MLVEKPAQANEKGFIQCLGAAKRQRQAVTDQRGVAAQFGQCIAKATADTEPVFRGALEKIKSARRSEEHTSELQSLMRISYAVFCLKKKNNKSYKQPQIYR